MKKILIAGFAVLTIIAQAQTHRFFYTVNFKADSLSKEYVEDVMVLDINEKETKFYSNEFLRDDSIRIATGEYQFTYPKLDTRLIRKTGSGENASFFSKTPLYYMVKTSDAQQWKILDDTKKIGNFNAQKATTYFGGWHWEAWFSSHFPFAEGPYKFRGLPGLILEIKDTGENYIFRFVGNKNIEKDYDTSFFIENFNEDQPLQITEKQWENLQKDYFINPMKDFHGDLIVQDESGNSVKMDPKELTVRMQDYLRKHNNPIELDKAIPYPRKK